MTGSPDPIFILLPYNCSSVESAANTRETWIRSPMSTFPPALFAAFATRIAGVTHPTTAASTCWAARGSVCPMDGLPFHLKSSELSFAAFLPFIFLFLSLQAFCLVSCRTGSFPCGPLPYRLLILSASSAAACLQSAMIFSSSICVSCLSFIRTFPLATVVTTSCPVTPNTR